MKMEGHEESLSGQDASLGQGSSSCPLDPFVTVVEVFSERAGA